MTSQRTWDDVEDRTARKGSVARQKVCVVSGLASPADILEAVFLAGGYHWELDGLH